MKTQGKMRQFLSLLLAVVMCLSVMPWTALAADGDTYTQVTSLSDITAGGEFVLVAKSGENYVALNTAIKSKPDAVSVTVADGKVTGTSLPVWTIAAIEGSGVSLSNGSNYLKYSSSTNLGSDTVAYDWTVTAQDNSTFRFSATATLQAGTVRGIGYQVSGNRFGGYAVSNNDGTTYIFDLLVFKKDAAGGSGTSVETTAPEETTTPAVVVSTIAEALAGTENDTFTVKGVVTLMDGQNVYVQDATGGICVRMSSTPSGITLGDTIIGTGTKSTYNGLPQLQNSTFEKSSGLELVAVEKKISELNVTTDLCTYVKVTDLTVTAVTPNGSVYNVDLEDVDGNKIQLYKGVIDTEKVKVGAVVTVSGAVGIYNNAPQLRNTLATEIVVTKEAETTDPVDPAISTIAEALAGAEGDTFTVKGVVTLIDGKNLYVQDATGAICVRMTDTPSGVALGDTIIGTGSKSVYNGLPQLQNSTFEKSSGLELVAAEKKLSELNATSDLCTYVKVADLTVTAVNGNTVDLEDANGQKIQLYKGVIDTEKVKVGAVVTVSGAVGIYQGNPQLRNTVATEVVVTKDAPAPTVTYTATLVTDVADLAAGDQIVIVASGSDFALSTAQTSNYRGQAAVTKDGSTVTFGEDVQIITLEAGTVDGTFAFNVDTGYLSAVSSSSNYLRTIADKTADGSWLITIDEAGVASVVAQGEYTRNDLRHNSGSTRFACYGSTNTMATVSIYKIPEEQPTGVADGDYVIWAPAYNMALSTVYGGHYNNGVAVTMENDKLSGYTAAEVWTVKNNEDGTITISCADGKLSMDTSYSSMPLNKANDTWTLEDAGTGLWYVKNVGRETYIEWYADKNNWSSYYKINAGSEGMFALQFTPAEEIGGEDPDDTITLTDGIYVIWNPAYGKALSTNTNGNGYYLGTDVTMAGDTLTGYGTTDIWDLVVNDDGTITITNNGQAMGTNKSGYLTLGGENVTWELTKNDDGTYYMKEPVKGKYLEWYASYSDWSMYGTIYDDSVDLFKMQFTPAELVYETDKTVVDDIAQWGGMTNANNTASVNGDKFESGDEKDTAAVYTAVVNGSAVTPYTTGGTAEAPLYYMGGKGVGSGTNDYLQFAVNTAGWGDMTLSFRLRASNSGVGEWTVQYSADGGNTFKNFNTGSYSYSWTKWGKNDEGESVVVDSGVTTGSITNGVAQTSKNPGAYVEFSFNVPDGAENCENLLIRLVPGATKANGKEGKPGGDSTVRIDTVVLSGSPIVDDGITSYVTVDPDGVEEDQAVGTELTMNCATEGATISYRVNGGQWQTYDAANKPTLESLPCDIEVKATAEGKAESVTRLFHYAAGTVENVKMNPNGGGLYIEGESTEIKLSSNTAGATIYYATSTDGKVFTEFAEYTDPIVVQKGFEKLVIKAYAVKEGFNDSNEVTRTFTERDSATYNIYFGQLHSHTNISDGSGTVTEAFEHASNVKNLDFLAVTDHSNSFDGEANGVLAQDGSTISEEWTAGHAAAEAITDEDFVGLYGFEMTWSNGLGHLNTFNTPGWQSRTQSQFKTASTALKNYYDALATVPESISQFNHPGTTFGDFSDFAHYTETYDDLITLIEVGNGEGAIGSSGYFPSYEYYTRALDKGWHVAPTNNQDNHKGLWGDANTGRSVVLANDLSEESIYDAMRNYRVYATEDNDLSIYYTLDGSLMGSILDSSDVGDNVNISVAISDPTDSSIGKVEVIVNGGLSAASQNVSGSSQTVTFSVPSDYTYYYIKITQPDGDIAVTAPVWVGEVEAVGISSFKAESQLTIAGEEQTFTLDLYNNEKKNLEVTSVVFTDKATGEVLHTDSTITSVPKLGTASCGFGYTFQKDGIYTVVATVKGVLNDREVTYTKDLEITVMPENITSNVIVDGTHFNDYVTGYYGANTANMTTIAAAQGIKVHVETEEITAEMLENCELLVISAPAKKTDTGNAGDYTPSTFEDEFIQLVVDYVKNGGNVIVCGLADYQDRGNYETSTEINKLLTALGSTMSINDDEVYDPTNNGGQAYRLYPEVFNSESEWTKGIVTKDDVAEGETYQVYSQYSGCSVNPGQGTWLVKGFDTTFTVDSDKDKKDINGETYTQTTTGDDGKTKETVYDLVVSAGDVCFLAAEDTPYGGTIFAAGGVFVSDFEVKAELDNIWDLPYANRTIYENILGITRTQPTVTPIEDVRASTEDGLGSIFVIEGYVTSGTDNENTTFFDAIYVQDETGGITVFPYSAAGLELGTKMRITGYTDAYQGDKEIQIISYEILDDEKNVIEPEKMSNKDAMDYATNGGELLQVEGEVTEVILTSDGKGVAQFVVKDEKGDEAKVFIDGYILSGTTGKNELASIVKEGNTVSAVGMLYMHPEGDSTESVAVLRVRNCDEVVLIKEYVPETDPTDPTETTDPTDSTESTEATDPTDPTDSTESTETTDPTDSTESTETTEATEPTTKPTETTAPSESTESTTKPGTGSNASTGDSSMIVLSFAVMVTALLAMAVLVLKRKNYTQQ